MEDEGKDEGKQQRPCEDNHRSSETVDRKRPFEDLVENQTAASSGTKNVVEGAKRPCIPNCTTVMDDTDEVEEVEVLLGADEMGDRGYFFRFEGNQIIVVGERPPPIKVRCGPPHPKALTYKRMGRRMDETGVRYINGDDPAFHIPWNPFPSPTYSTPKPPTASDTEA